MRICTKVWGHALGAGSWCRRRADAESSRKPATSSCWNYIRQVALYIHRWRDSGLHFVVRHEPQHGLSNYFQILTACWCRESCATTVVCCTCQLTSRDLDLQNLVLTNPASKVSMRQLGNQWHHTATNLRMLCRLLLGKLARSIKWHQQFANRSTLQEGKNGNFPYCIHCWQASNL